MIITLLKGGRPEKTALAGIGKRPLSYRALASHVEQTVASLNMLGLGRNDRVAIVLPNGPLLASAFLGVAAGASPAPLNPALRQADFRFYLSDLRAKALLVDRASESPAIAAAKALHIPVLRIISDHDASAGIFRLAGEKAGPAKSDGPARPEDIALVLHTSGTTSRPKLVPLSHRNLCASAGHIVRTLKLSPEDHCLNIMPLFHIHGLVAAVVSSLAAGSSVCCTPGLNVQEFFRWLADEQPSWYTAVPTMHHAILAHAPLHRVVLERVRLRFIRSSSAALPMALMRSLEQTFQAPVIESYGMTEAAHQMASNPLPPAVRKPGTVGPAAGPEIAIMDSSGTLLPPGSAGEVVIRGPNVMAAYENNPEANAQAFANGWFRTGDEAVVDGEGYLTIKGRLKEIIVRGGQKISPKEIDDVLLEHPEISSAAAFGFPHPTLGEEIAAVVVLREAATLSEPALMQYLSTRLPAFKMPRRLVWLKDIPKGATGKIQRQKLAAALGMNEAVSLTRGIGKAAREREPTPLEAQLERIWGEQLGLDTVGLNDNFFMLGGDSLQAVQLLRRVEEALGHPLPHSVLIDGGTISEMAASIERNVPSGCLVPFRRTGTRAPFFCVHGLDGQVLSLRNLSTLLETDQPFYGLQCVGANGKEAPLTRIEDMAARYLREIKDVQPNGPYYIGGYSMGGRVAFEMAHQLVANGEKVGLLALIDAYSGQGRQRSRLSDRVRRRWRELSGLRIADAGPFLAERFGNAWRLMLETFQRDVTRAKWRLYRVAGGRVRNVMAPRSLGEANAMAVAAYTMRPLDCEAVLLKANLRAIDHPDMHDGWKVLIRGTLDIRSVDANHLEVMNEPYVRTLAAALSECLKQAQAHASAESQSVDSRDADMKVVLS